MANCKHMLYFATAATLLIMAVSPVRVYAGLQTYDSYSSTRVECAVEPEYSFSLPESAELRYPDTQTEIGQFHIGKLLLASDESLSVQLTADALTLQGTDDSLPYDVSLDVPAVFDESQSGNAYDIWLTIDAETFSAAKTGIYTAPLVFRVISAPSGSIVWQGTVSITVLKDSNDPIPDTDGSGPITPAMPHFPWGWLCAGTGALLVLIFLIILLIRRKKGAVSASD